MTTHSFEVELRGLVDLVSHHLYSGPQVYLRELLQNAVDALRARADMDADVHGAAVVPEDADLPVDPDTAVTQRPAPAPRVLLVPADVSGDGRLYCRDTGIGLSPTAVTEHLSRIGASVKRDELGFARSHVLGQFGTGLLSCFLVSEEIEVVSRSVVDAPSVRWRATTQGRYTLDVVDDPQVGPWEDPGIVGTCVMLTPRPEARHWVEETVVTALAEEYAGMLPDRIDIRRSNGSTCRNSGYRPWWWSPTEEALPEEDTRAQVESLLGVPVLATLAVSVPEAGLRGAVALLGSAASPATDIGHRVYAKGMLVGASVPGLLPSWAFFARIVADTDQLRLTVSREALHADDLLEQVRQRLGDQLRLWLRRTARTNPPLFQRFLQVHEPAIRSVAAQDQALFEVVLPWLTFDTTVGPQTLPDLARRFTEIRYVPTREEYRRIAPVAQAHDLGLVNAGHAHDEDLITRFAVIDPTIPVEPITTAEVISRMAPRDDLSPAVTARFRILAQDALDEADVDVELRGFEPHTLPGVIDDDRDSRRRRTDRRTAQARNDVWAQVVTDLDDGGSDRPRVLFNYYNNMVRRVAELKDDTLLSLGVKTLYCQVLLLGRATIPSADLGLLDRTLVGLLDRAAAVDGIRVEQR